MKKLFSNNLLDILIETTYLGIIFLVPVYFGFVFITENPFDLQKMVLFKILLIGLIFLSLVKYLLIKDKGGVIKMIWGFLKKYWFWPSVLLLFFLVSVFWSINPVISFWGSLDRQFGWMSLANFFLFSFFLSLNLLFFKNRERRIETILLTISISATLISAYAVLQFLGIDFLTWNEPASITKRAFSTLGQPNFLGSFLLLTLILPLYLIKKNNKVYSKILLGLSFGIQFLALIFSGSRGAWMGFLVGFLFYLGYLFLKRNKRILIFGGLVFIIFILALFLGTNTFSQRFKSSFDFSSGGASARISLWLASFDGIKKNPWGYGIENQKDVLVSYYEADWGTFNKVNVMFDRAHNIFLDILLEVGIIGLIICLVFVLFIFRLLFNNIKNEKNKDLSLIIFISLLSYLVSLFFGFATTVSALYFWLFFSIIIVINFDSKNLNIKLKSFDYKLKIISIALFLIFLIGVYQQINNLKIDYYFFKGKQFFYYREVPSAILIFSYLREESPRHHQYYYKMIDMIFDHYLNFPDESSRFLVKNEVFAINSIIEDSNNDSFSYLLAEAQVLAIMERFDDSRALFAQVENISPNYPNVYYKKAKANILENDFEEALKNYNQALNLLPEENMIEGGINLRAFRDYQSLIRKEINLIK